jgi:hypothetical protein
VTFRHRYINSVTDRDSGESGAERPAVTVRDVTVRHTYGSGGRSPGVPRGRDDDGVQGAGDRPPTDESAALLLLAVGAVTPAAGGRLLDQPRGSVSRAFGRLREDDLAVAIGGGSAHSLSVGGHRYARRVLEERAEQTDQS